MKILLRMEVRNVRISDFLNLLNLFFCSIRIHIKYGLHDIIIFVIFPIYPLTSRILYCTFNVILILFLKFNVLLILCTYNIYVLLNLFYVVDV